MVSGVPSTTQKTTNQRTVVAESFLHIHMGNTQGGLSGFQEQLKDSEKKAPE